MTYNNTMTTDNKNNTSTCTIGQ